MATALQTTSPKIPTSSQALSAKLNELVLSGDNPVVGPKSAAELRAFAEQPEPPLVKESEVDTMIGKLAMATAQPRLSPAEAKERMALYWLALRDLPVDDLRQAFVALLRSCKFLPAPAEIRTAALREGAVRKYAKSRARHLAWKHEQEWRPQGEMVDPAEVRALLSRDAA